MSRRGSACGPLKVPLRTTGSRSACEAPGGPADRCDRGPRGHRQGYPYGPPPCVRLFGSRSLPGSAGMNAEHEHPRPAKGVGQPFEVGHGAGRSRTAQARRFRPPADDEIRQQLVRGVRMTNLSPGLTSPKDRSTLVRPCPLGDDHVRCAGRCAEQPAHLLGKDLEQGVALGEGPGWQPPGSARACRSPARHGKGNKIAAGRRLLDTQREGFNPQPSFGCRDHDGRGWC
jgi:hypothetical protein